VASKPILKRPISGRLNVGCGVLAKRELKICGKYDTSSFSHNDIEKIVT